MGSWVSGDGSIMRAKTKRGLGSVLANMSYSPVGLCDTSGSPASVNPRGRALARSKLLSAPKSQDRRRRQGGVGVVVIDIWREPAARTTAPVQPMSTLGLRPCGAWLRRDATLGSPGGLMHACPPGLQILALGRVWGSERRMLRKVSNARQRPNLRPLRRYRICTATPSSFAHATSAVFARHIGREIAPARRPAPPLRGGGDLERSAGRTALSPVPDTGRDGLALCWGGAVDGRKLAPFSAAKGHTQTPAAGS